MSSVPETLAFTEALHVAEASVATRKADARTKIAEARQDMEVTPLRIGSDCYQRFDTLAVATETGAERAAVLIDGRRGV